MEKFKCKKGVERAPSDKLARRLEISSLLDDFRPAPLEGPVWSNRSLAYKEHTPKAFYRSPQVFQGGLQQRIALSDDRRTTPIQNVHVR